MKTHHYRTFRRHTRTHASGTLRVITQHGRCRDVDDVAVYGVGQLFLPFFWLGDAADKTLVSPVFWHHTLVYVFLRVG